MDMNADRRELIIELNRSWELDLTEGLSADELEMLLAGKLNALIQSDFSALVRLLYRIDINESRLRNLLTGNEREDAGKIIAKLIVERQWQKILSRRQYKAGEQAPAEADAGKTDTGRSDAGPGKDTVEERW
jgi:hypothetical protein